MDNLKHLSDEELLLLSRMGNLATRDALAKRYYDNRYFHACRALPGAKYAYDVYEFNQEFFTTFYNATESFRFGSARFKRYLETALGHDMARCAKKNPAMISLDAPIPHLKDETITFEEVMTATSMSDPKVYLNYAEEALALKQAPDYIDKKVLLIASLKIEGKTFAEISRLTKMTLKQVKLRFGKFAKFLKDAIEKGEVSGVKAKKFFRKSD